MSASLPSLVEVVNADNLPTPPTVATEILRLTRDEGVSMDDLAMVISQDPTLTAKLMKLANSSLFARGTEAVSLEQAMMRLGLKTVKLMALSFSLVKGVEGSEAGGFDFPQFWKRGLLRAAAGRDFAALVNEKCGQEAFLCGLLSRLGQLALHVAAGDAYKEVIEASGGELPSPAMEEKFLGFNHCEVSGILLEKWELPKLISVVVRHVDDPSKMPEDTSEEALNLATMVRVASLVEAVLLDQEKGDAMQALTDTFELAFDLDESALEKFLVDMQASMNEIANMLSMEIEAQEGDGAIVDAARMQMMQISLGATVELQDSQDRNEQLEQDKVALEHKANTDKMTGLNNRAAFDQELSSQVAATQEAHGERSFGLLVMDIDKFKLFNDTHGHAVGDEVLKSVASVIMDVTPAEYFPARYGGEEFVVVMSDADDAKLFALAEEIRTAIESSLVKTEGKELSVTISIGGACASNIVQDEQALDLFKAADGFLYEAKEAGRNQCVCRTTQPEAV